MDVRGLFDRCPHFLDRAPAELIAGSGRAQILEEKHEFGVVRVDLGMVATGYPDGQPRCDLLIEANLTQVVQLRAASRAACSFAELVFATKDAGAAVSPE